MEESQKFSFEDTTATRKVFELTKRIRAVSGGTSASKTISILIWLIDYCQKQYSQPKIVTTGSESYPHLEKGAMRDFELIMKDRNYWRDERWNRTKHTYQFETGNILEFSSFDTYGKAHGPRRDVLFLNEANNLAYNIVDQLIARTREVIWMDWNPTVEFWFYTDMLPVRNDVDFITLTYKDNEALDQTTIQEIESHQHNKAWWTVYGLGQLGQLESQIFKDWQVLEEMPSFPHEARLWRYGLDFGYTNDPSAGVAVYEYNGGYILDEVLYLKGLSNKQIADTFLNLPRALIVADSAEPKSIDELRSYGLNVLPSQKGKDSVLNGIQFVQDLKISITKRSLNLLKEYRNYLWMTDRDGKIINEPSDIYNHLMDALRYALANGRQPQWKPNDPGGVKPLFPGMIA
jgi:phage terminase large subunit